MLEDCSRSMWLNEYSNRKIKRKKMVYSRVNAANRRLGSITRPKICWAVSAGFCRISHEFRRMKRPRYMPNPAETAQQILGLVIDPSRRLAAFTLLYTIFFLFIFLLLYSFSHMLREQSSVIEKVSQPNNATK